jgi:hypothetical protein
LSLSRNERWALDRVAHRSEMNASGDRHMRAGEMRVPDRIAYGFTVRHVRAVCRNKRALKSHLDMARVDLSASNMAEWALSRL